MSVDDQAISRHNVAHGGPRNALDSKPRPQHGPDDRAGRVDVTAEPHDLGDAIDPAIGIPEHRPDAGRDGRGDVGPPHLLARNLTVLPDPAHASLHHHARVFGDEKRDNGPGEADPRIGRV